MISSVKLKWSERSADQKAAQEVYDVITSGDKSDDAVKVRDASGLPAVRQPLASDPTLRCTTRTAKAVGRTLWSVTVDYAKDEDGSADKKKKDGDGTNGWIIAYSSASFNDVIDKDAAGNPIINPVGEPLDPHISREYGLTRISCVKEFDPPGWLVFPPTASKLNGILYTTNVGDFLGWRKGSVKFVDYAIEPFTGKDGNQWTRFRAEFLIRMWTDPVLGNVDWQERRMVVGTRYKTERDQPLPGQPKIIYVMIADDRGQPVNRPVPIDLNGNVIGIGQNPVWKLWKIYGESDFKIFGL